MDSLRAFRFAVVSLLLAGTAAAASDDADREAARLNAEAKGLFVTVIADRRKGSGVAVGTCGLDVAWGAYGVPYDIAHQALDLDVHGDLTNPGGVSSPADVLAGAGVPKDAFCDKATRDKYWQGLIDSVKSDLAKGAKAGPPNLVFDSYSFPLFDRDFTRAVVIKTGLQQSVHINGKALIFFPPEGAGYALLYRRDKAGWHQVNEIELFTVD